MVLRDAVTGAPKDPNPLVPLGTMPDYAPDGSAVVFAKPAVSPCPIPTMCMPGINKGSIALLPWDGTAWGAERILVQQTGTENNYYPAFSPDGKWILYNHSSAANSYDAGDARLRMLQVETGTVIDLTLANKYGGNSWPKWSPFVQVHRGGTIMWLTFSSRRPYGWQSVSCAGGGTCAQIWMAAVDIDKALAGIEDPSYAAFRLPFQDIATGNHIAQWVPTVVRTPCDDQGECGPGEICTAGQCVPDIQ
jgi:TolB protein